MKKLLFLMLIFISTISYPQMIFDHAFVDETQIPANYIELVKNNVDLQWVGASHGHQIMTGIELAELDNPLLDATVSTEASGWCLPESGPFRCMNGFIPYYTQCNCTSNWGAPGAFWLPPDGPVAMAKVFNCGYDVNVAGWTWCTELHDSNYDLQAYFNQMEIYEDLYPFCTFIYSTATTEYTSDQGYNRWNNNNLIRQYCLDNDKILLDFADIECWYNGQFSYYIHTTGDTIPTRHSAYPDDGYHHTNWLNCANKGRVVWSMMAYIQGWNPIPPPNEAPVMKYEQIFPIAIPDVTDLYYVGQIEATDPDGDNIVFDFQYTGPKDVELDQKTGDMWVQHYQQYSISSYYKKFRVICTDDGEPPLSDDAVITIRVKVVSTKSENLHISDDEEIIIYDLTGRIVLKLEDDTKLKQELLTLKKGIYVYKYDDVIKKIVR